MSASVTVLETVPLAERVAIARAAGGVLVFKGASLEELHTLILDMREVVDAYAARAVEISDLGQSPQTDGVNSMPEHNTPSPTSWAKPPAHPWINALTLAIGARARAVAPAFGTDLRWILRVAFGVCLGITVAWAIDDWRLSRQMDVLAQDAD